MQNKQRSAEVLRKKSNRVASGGAPWDPITLLAKVPIGITRDIGSAFSPKFGTGSQPLHDAKVRAAEQML